MYDEDYLIDQQQILLKNRTDTQTSAKNNIIEIPKVEKVDKTKDVYYHLREGLWPLMHKSFYQKDV